MRRSIFVALAVPLAVMLIACGGSSNSNKSSNTTAQPTTAATSTSVSGSSSTGAVTGSSSTAIPSSSSPVPGNSSTTQTPAAGASGSSGPTGSTGTPSATTITLVAKDLKYDKSEIDAPADTSFTVILDNQDQSVPHNFAVYSGKDLAQKLFTGDLDTGPAKKSYTVPPLKAGTYYFRCDVHPDTMNGTLTVK